MADNVFLGLALKFDNGALNYDRSVSI